MSRILFVLLALGWLSALAQAPTPTRTPTPIPAPAAAAEAPGTPGLCPTWSDPVAAGSLDPARFPETSGMQLSRDGERLFVINDGREPVFHVAAPDGGAPRAVRVAGFAPFDLEDLAYGRCGDGQCLVIGDIGDNAHRRRDVQIALVADRDVYPDTVEPFAVVVASYPDGPQDAESIALDPAGDLWLVSKSPAGRLEPARLYRLPAAALAAGGEHDLEAVGEIDLAAVGSSALNRRRIVTSMDIAPDGERFVLLTYEGAVEFGFAPGRGLPGRNGWQAGHTHRLIATQAMIQAESISYADGGRSVLYTTESIGGSPVPIVRQHCADSP